MRRSEECECMGCDAFDKGFKVCDCDEPVCPQCGRCPDHHVDHDELDRQAQTFTPEQLRSIGLYSNWKK